MTVLRLRNSPPTPAILSPNARSRSASCSSSLSRLSPRILTCLSFVARSRLTSLRTPASSLSRDEPCSRIFVSWACRRATDAWRSFRWCRSASIAECQLITTNNNSWSPQCTPRPASTHYPTSRAPYSAPARSAAPSPPCLRSSSGSWPCDSPPTGRWPPFLGGHTRRPDISLSPIGRCSSTLTASWNASILALNAEKPRSKPCLLFKLS